MRIFRWFNGEFAVICSFHFVIAIVLFIGSFFRNSFLLLLSLFFRTHIYWHTLWMKEKESERKIFIFNIIFDSSYSACNMSARVRYHLGLFISRFSCSISHLHKHYFKRKKVQANRLLIYQVNLKCTQQTINASMCSVYIYTRTYHRKRYENGWSGFTS